MVDIALHLYKQISIMRCLGTIESIYALVIRSAGCHDFATVSLIFGLCLGSFQTCICLLIPFYCPFRACGRQHM